MEATLNKNENYTWKFVKKNPGNIMEFCHHGKMGTLKEVISLRKHAVIQFPTLIELMDNAHL